MRQVDAPARPIQEIQTAVWRRAAKNDVSRVTGPAKRRNGQIGGRERKFGRAVNKKPPGRIPGVEKMIDWGVAGYVPSFHDAR
jgi:hypothetical protein